MHVRSDRRHRFAVEPDELWAAVTAVDRYPDWWPWLRSFEATALVVGDAWRCVVQPPLPYSVRFTLTIDEVVPAQRVAATVRGDITGTASVELTARPEGGTEARLVADLAPTHLLLRAMGVLAGPVVRRAHDWVLDTGARQFRDRALRAGS